MNIEQYSSFSENRKQYRRATQNINTTNKVIYMKHD